MKYLIATRNLSYVLSANTKRELTAAIKYIKQQGFKKVFILKYIGAK